MKPTQNTREARKPVPAGVLIPLLIHEKTKAPVSTTSFCLKSNQGPISLPSTTEIVFTVRAQTVEHHKGQISFPGGVFETTDASLECTALREAFEEIGLPPEQVEIVAELPEVPTVATDFQIKPFVGLVRQRPIFKPNPQEIGQILLVPLAHLFAPENSKLEYYERGGARFPMRAYHYGQHRIWGATGRVLQTLLENFFEKR